MEHITFPYPYMNGRLHVGHAFILMKCDLAARYAGKNGKRVLFPMGFHCTGMPICSSAAKLADGDDSVADSLLAMGVARTDLPLFNDPRYWVKYFPPLAQADLQELQLSVDWSRSFVTTDINPYYDSFIRWQFKRLKAAGFVFKGNRPCIFSLRHQQPCADHDRASGEGVKPVRRQLKYMIGGNGELGGLGVFQTDLPEKGPKIKACFMGMVGLMSERIYNCLLYQGYAIMRAEGVVPPPRAKLMERPEVPVELPEIYLPEKSVVSRSGDECIVAVSEQWYINYADPSWKGQVIKYLTDEIDVTEELRTQLLDAAANLHEWCFSREVGLGTKIPWDDRYVIDSLSDSTIYMAYYTVAHLLHKDLYGQVPSLVTPDELNDAFWNGVFLDTEVKDSIFEKVLLCNREFRKWYPVTLRVSGKDLINNHLVMTIYNHIAIWSGMCPRSFRVHGYVNINGEKMAKSTGNFITIRAALDKYRPDVLRMLLAEAGDTMNDSNLVFKQIPSLEVALDEFYSLYEQVKGINGLEGDGSYDYTYHTQMSHAFLLAKEAFEKGRFRDGITACWRKGKKYMTDALRYLGTDQEPAIVRLYVHIAAHYLQHVVPKVAPLCQTPKHQQIIGKLNQHPDVNVIDAREYAEQIVAHIKKNKLTDPHITVVQPIFGFVCSEIPYINKMTLGSITVGSSMEEIDPRRKPFKYPPVY